MVFDVIVVARRGWHRYRGGGRLRERVVVGRRAEWARPVRFGEMVAGEQIDEVEIRRVGQRPAPEPAQREDDKLAVRNAAMRRHEFEIGRASGRERVCKYV